MLTVLCTYSTYICPTIQKIKYSTQYIHDTHHIRCYLRLYVMHCTVYVVNYEVFRCLSIIQKFVHVHRICVFLIYIRVRVRVRVQYSSRNAWDSMQSVHVRQVTTLMWWKSTCARVRVRVRLNGTVLMRYRIIAKKLLTVLPTTIITTVYIIQCSCTSWIKYVLYIELRSKSQRTKSDQHITYSK